MSEQLESIKVLVVGDWVIDENWIVTNFETETSTHIGKQHYRSLIDYLNSQIIGLCGAGNVARSLHGLSKSEIRNLPEFKKSLEVYGIGLWHPSDTKLIASLFSNVKISNQTPLNLSGMSPASQSASSSYSLCGKCLNEDDPESKLCPAEGDSCNYLKTLSGTNCGTTRAIRIYKMSAGGDPEHLWRIDWQTPFVEEDKNFVKFEEFLLDRHWGNISVIVVNDLNKGCITPELISVLIKKYPNAGWFIRTKDMDVDWLELIPEGNFRLRVVGAEYVPDRSKTKRWYYENEASIEAIGELKELGLFGKINRKDTDRWVVALKDDNRILALHKSAGNMDIKGISVLGIPAPQKINVGRSSVLFASCIASMLGCYEDNSDETMLKRAGFHAYKWTEFYSSHLQLSHLKKGSESDNYCFLGNHKDALKCYSVAKELGPSLYTKSFDVSKTNESWRKSFEGKGIVEEELHLWRGFSCIDGYIATRHKLRAELNKLYQSINQFVKEPKITGSLNCLILGRPGWGKTFLAEKIADTFNFNPILFNLSQLTSNDQIIDCFDAISSLQNLRRNKPVLAFFDELDSKIDGQYTFPLFLSPILDGTYRRGGHIFYLTPCIWMFAAAKGPEELLIQKDDKFPDFHSRINAPTVRLDFGVDEGKLDAQSMTEQVYLGVKLLLDNFADISLVNKCIITFFHELKMNHGVRSLEQAVKRFKNAERGKVGPKNLPDYKEISYLVRFDDRRYEELRRLDLDREEEYVTIHSHPA